MEGEWRLYVREEEMELGGGRKELRTLTMRLFVQ